MSYNEDDAWGSPHRTINTLNTTGINCRFPKVNFLWSYFLLAFKWKYCSYNLYKLCYIVLNGTHIHDTMKIYFYHTRYFYLQVNLWLSKLSVLFLVNFKEFFLQKGNKIAFMYFDVTKQELVQSPKQWRPWLCKRAQRFCMNFW